MMKPIPQTLEQALKNAGVPIPEHLWTYKIAINTALDEDAVSLVRLTEAVMRDGLWTSGTRVYQVSLFFYDARVL